MTWPVRFDARRIKLEADGSRISATDAERQTATVRELLKRLERQPGVVLADEVGMGKTFVALAVAASAVWTEERRRPVIVMVPPSLQEKWPSDFAVFKALCLRRKEDRVNGLHARTAKTGVEFFKLLDDPPSRRCQIIFLTHGALHRSLSDPWVKLAILKRAFRVKSLAPQRRVFHRWAARVIRVKSWYGDPRLFRELLNSHTDRWRGILKQYGEDPGDDPVPKAIARALNVEGLDLSDLQRSLRHSPLRDSAYIEGRLTDIRRAVAGTFQDVWREAIVKARFQSPLLILDEAHHAKNPATRLASLFVGSDAEKDRQLIEGALANRFERMLFLTATPFQLGHNELLNVISRFQGIRWREQNPVLSENYFGAELETLGHHLDEAHVACTALDRRWSRLTGRHLEIAVESEEALETWWKSVRSQPDEQPERVQEIRRGYERASTAMRQAESELRPWVIRHLKPRRFEKSGAARRLVLPGASIESDQVAHEGLTVREEAVLPFLLAARSQAVLERRSRADGGGARGMTFAEGLASSYEAFLETRAATESARGFDSLIDEARAAGDGLTVDDTLRWYIGWLARSLPDSKSFGDHPKIAATVARTLKLWEEKQKVLIFCHWRKTGDALQTHLSQTLDALLTERACRLLGCAADEVDRLLENVGKRFDRPRPMYRVLRAQVDEILGVHRDLTAKEREDIFDVIRRFIRTPSFLLRYYPLGESESPAAFERALAERDESGMSLQEKFEKFVEFLAVRCTPSERSEYLQALLKIQPGSRYGRDLEDGEVIATRQLLPNVRMATGGVKREFRRHLLLGFNTPFFPEILVASSVLAEGVDLQLDCRHVIHHDLAWNPSTLEQRTGRIDRIGAKADRIEKPIHVYLPYIAATQDEKMYRVVRDRERWFQVLMGEKYALDEAVTRDLENRIPLPESAARELGFRLEVWRG